jgi:micrococcal nuclease
VVLVLALVGVLDGADVMGRFGSDLSRYDNKVFLVCRNVDGDTFHLQAPDGWKTSTVIRLWGVDTPETVKPNAKVDYWGPEASAFTKGLTADQWVRVRLVPGYTRDKYHRLLVYVYLPDDRMLNSVLVEQGHAYADPRFDHPFRVEFQQQMVRARKSALGLWAGVKPDQLPDYIRRTMTN